MVGLKVVSRKGAHDYFPHHMFISTPSQGNGVNRNRNVMLQYIW